MNWIYTKNKLPEKQQKYFVTTCWNTIEIFSYDLKSKNWFDGTLYYHPIAVIAWMVLPKPAKFKFKKIKVTSSYIKEEYDT